jgi:hypothetical protein
MAGSELFRELALERVEGLISREFDPPVRCFSVADRKQSGIVASAIKGLPDTLQRLKRQVSLGQFLYGCNQATKNLPIEYLIVGFGHRSRGLQIKAVKYFVGTESTVSVPLSVEQEIHQHILSDHTAEVVIYHNHPRGLTHALFNHGPVASPADRNVWKGYNLNPLLLVKRALDGGRVHFYLGENKKVREFDGPNILQLIQWIQQVMK